MSLEDSFYSLAQDTGKPCVILCDRGAMDGSAYMTADQWEDLKAEHDLDTVTLRDTCVSCTFLPLALCLLALKHSQPARLLSLQALHRDFPPRDGCRRRREVLLAREQRHPHRVDRASARD